MVKKLIPVFGFVLITAIFFWQVLFKGLVPIPSDTIVGLYYPYRDIYSSNYPNGIPFKNFLITDPVRQHYPWKNLSIDSIKNLEMPTWNPYSFSGTPNLANFQSGVFYPFNFLFFLLQFINAWSIFIILQPILAGIFLYYYLRNLKLDEHSSFFGGIVFAFSGFFVTWLEWGTILHTALWLPLILLCIDKLSFYINHKEKFSFPPLSLKFRRTSNFKFPKIIAWSLVFIFAMSASFFAGHLQTFFYLFLFSVFYLIGRIWQNKNKLNLTLTFLGLSLISFIITLGQLVPSLKFIELSGRNLDQALWQKEGWFIPWKHLVQFLIPDFFGNPTTLNYWGAWNYGELTGFVGIVAISLSLLAVLFRRDKKTFLFTGVVILTLIIALPNPISRLPYVFNFPFISTAQPTRILFITDFALSVLAALGLSYFIKHAKLKQIIIPLGVVGLIMLISFLYMELGSPNLDLININVAKRNILFPGAIFVASVLILLIYPMINKRFKNYLILILIALTIVELFRFSWKFNTFAKREYLYPENNLIKYVQSNIGDYRIATSDPQVMPPNFPIMHKINSVEGYDPLYIERYAQFIAAINRNKPDINPPFGFNRIIRVENISSDLVDLMGVKYVLSLTDLNVQGLEKVYQEGQTSVYENKDVLPRAFFVKNIKAATDKNNAIELMFDKNFNPKDEAIVEESIPTDFSKGSAKIIKYSEDEVIIETQNDGEGFLVLTDSFYPTWRAKINGQEQKIYTTDFVFRGVIVPKGKNEVVFENSLL